MKDTLLPILLGHNRWANRVLLLECQSLTPEQFHARFDIGPGSLHDTIRHIVGAMLRWADRVDERLLRASIENDDQRFSPAALLALLDEAHADLSTLASRLAATDAFEQTIRFEIPEESIRYTFTKAAALLHVLTHGMHHRAQALNIRRRLGLPPLGLDLDVPEWESVETGQLTDPVAIQAR